MCSLATLGLLISLAGLDSVASSKCGQICGQAPIPDRSRAKRETLDEEYYSDYIHEDDTRIVNGYDADKRPWLVYINVHNSACGGALVNDK